MSYYYFLQGSLTYIYLDFLAMTYFSVFKCIGFPTIYFRVGKALKLVRYSKYTPELIFFRMRVLEPTFRTNAASLTVF